jgi:hypothetical protein
LHEAIPRWRLVAARLPFDPRATIDNRRQWPTLTPAKRASKEPWAPAVARRVTDVVAARSSSRTRSDR